MQAIRTRYIPASNTRGAYFKAQGEFAAIRSANFIDKDMRENHLAAAKYYAKKMGWYGTYVGAVFGNDYYWVPTDAVDHGDSFTVQS